MQAVSITDPRFGRAYARTVKRLYDDALASADPTVFWTGDSIQDWANGTARDAARADARRAIALKGWRTRRRKARR